MEKRIINQINANDALLFAKTVLETEMICIVNDIRYVGGGYFGYVYKAKINKSPNILIIKACRVEGMCEQEANGLIRLGEDSLIKVPNVYFIKKKSKTLPIDFLCMEYSSHHQ